MSNIDQVKLKAMAAELAKDIKTQADLASLSSMLLKMTVVMVKYFRKEFKLLSLKFPYALQGFGNLAPS